MLVAAPCKKWPQDRPVDLYEFQERTRKLLYDKNGYLQFVDVNWKEEASLENLIVSYHNFENTPDLEKVLAEMKARHPKARYYKIATFANSTLDALKMIHFQRRHEDVIGLCMGEKGAITRILAPVFGAPIIYAPLSEEEKNAPGQLLWSELDVIYHFRSLSRKTCIYGLIGDPVNQSIGHLFHNEAFRKAGVDGVYVKMCVAPHELRDFFELIRELPIFGLSVTAPLKELVLPYLQSMSKEGKAIGAVNTLYRTERGWEAINTDSSAAADALGDVKGKKVVILGAGGAAKAIAYEVIQRGALVTLVNRTAVKGEQLADELGCAFAVKVPEYDILVNATSSSEPLENVPFIPQKTVMDIAIRTTPFLQRAQREGCEVMDGLPMFFNQALLQSITWQRLIISSSKS